MLPEMRASALRWITDCLMIYCVIWPSSVGAQASARSVLLFSSDASPASDSNNLISIQLDSITLNKLIANAEAVGKVVKKINFRDVNGFEKLVKGESTKFSFLDDDTSSTCDARCEVSCKGIPTPSTPPTPRISIATRPLTTTTTRKPFITRKGPSTTNGPTYLPPVSLDLKDEGITRPSTSVPTTTQATTRRTFPSIQGTTQRETIRTTQRASTTQRTTRPTIPTRPRISTPGPAYLPLAKISTVRKSTVTERSYPPATWPSTTRIYTQTFPTWSAPIRRVTSLEPRIASSTAKYEYRAPSNSLIYAGEEE